MSNVLEFYLKMKDMMSSGLVKVAKTGKESFAQVEKAVKNMQAAIDLSKKKNDILGSSYDSLTRKAKQLDQAINSSTSVSHIRAARRELDALNRQMSKHPGNGSSTSKGSGGGSLFGGMLSRFAPAAMLAGALSFGVSSANAAMDFGATTKSFQVLTGSAGKGKDLSNTLNKLQQDTILGPEVFKSAQTLMSFGVAAEKVVNIEKQLGDVSMGNKDKFQALTLAFSQTQAAGRLMGQDLLQYVNAGFNPLQTMSERWKEFGFQQKQSVGQLKEMMEKGKISAEMVAKAFELATTEGGKFNGMMDAVAKTTYGKLQILEGQWENFKIGVGNSNMYIAEGLMDAASKTMNWINVTKSGSEVLRNEQSDLSATVAMITNLNEGNSIRKNLLTDLVASYPDLFKNIDIENVKNGDLLKTLNDINASYKDRIKIAQSGEMLDFYKKEGGEYLDTQKRWLKMKQLSYGDASDREQALGMRTLGERLSFVNLDDMRGYNSAGKLQQGMEYYNKKIAGVQQKQQQDAFYKTLRDANNLAQDGNKMTELFGTDKEGLAKRSAFQKLAQKLHYGSDDKWHTQGGGMAYVESLRDAMSMSPGKIKTKEISVGDNTSKGNEADRIGRSVAGGGQRNINITIGKMVEKIEIHADSLDKGLEHIQDKVEDVLLRILNSGASVQ